MPEENQEQSSNWLTNLMSFFQPAKEGEKSGFMQWLESLNASSAQTTAAAGPAGFISTTNTVPLKTMLVTDVAQEPQKQLFSAKEYNNVEAILEITTSNGQKRVTGASITPGHEKDANALIDKLNSDPRQMGNFVKEAKPYDNKLHLEIKPVQADQSKLVKQEELKFISIPTSQSIKEVTRAPEDPNYPPGDPKYDTLRNAIYERHLAQEKLDAANKTKEKEAQKTETAKPTGRVVTVEEYRAARAAHDQTEKQAWEEYKEAKYGKNGYDTKKAAAIQRLGEESGQTDIAGALKKAEDLVSQTKKTMDLTSQAGSSEGVKTSGEQASKAHEAAKEAHNALLKKHRELDAKAEGLDEVKAAKTKMGEASKRWSDSRKPMEAMTVAPSEDKKPNPNVTSQEYTDFKDKLCKESDELVKYGAETAKQGLHDNTIDREKVKRGDLILDTKVASVKGSDQFKTLEDAIVATEKKRAELQRAELTADFKQTGEAWKKSYDALKQPDKDLDALQKAKEAVESATAAVAKADTLKKDGEVKKDATVLDKATTAHKEAEGALEKAQEAYSKLGGDKALQAAKEKSEKEKDALNKKDTELFDKYKAAEQKLNAFERKHGAKHVSGDPKDIDKLKAELAELEKAELKVKKDTFDPHLHKDVQHVSQQQQKKWASQELGLGNQEVTPSGPAKTLGTVAKATTKAMVDGQEKDVDVIIDQKTGTAKRADGEKFAVNAVVEVTFKDERDGAKSAKYIVTATNELAVPSTQTSGPRTTEQTRR